LIDALNLRVILRGLLPGRLVPLMMTIIFCMVASAGETLQLNLVPCRSGADGRLLFFDESPQFSHGKG